MKRQTFRLYGFHVAAIVNVLIGLAIWFLFKFPVYPMRTWSFVHFAYYLTMITVFLLLIFCFDYFLEYRAKFSPHTLWQHFRDRFFKRHLLWMVASVIISFELVINIHTNLKQLIPFINATRYDVIFAKSCQTLHLGINLPLYLSSTYNLLGITTLFDWLYSCWFYLIAFTISYFVYQQDTYKCDRFITSLFYMHGLGVVIGLCFPSFGPFYIYPGHFPAHGMSSCFITQTVLRTVVDHLSLVDVKLGHSIFFGYGLMAMPSLHVAVCFLYVLFFWKEGPALRCLFVVYLFVVFITSLMSGWHYAIDGYAAIPLVYISIALSNLTIKIVNNSACKPCHAPLQRPVSQ